MARTDRGLGEPLPLQLPNQPPTHPQTLRLRESAFQPQSPIGFYPQFPKVITNLRADYRRVTEQSAGALRPLDLHGLVESQ